MIEDPIERIQGPISESTALAMYNEATTGAGCVAFANMCRFRTPDEGKCYPANKYFSHQIGPIVNDAIIVGANAGEAVTRKSNIDDIRHGFSLLNRLVLNSKKGDCEDKEVMLKGASHWESLLAERMLDLVGDDPMPRKIDIVRTEEKQSAAPLTKPDLVCSYTNGSENCLGQACLALTCFQHIIQAGIGDGPDQSASLNAAKLDLGRIATVADLSDCKEVSSFDVQAALSQMQATQS